ncbi:hypothetical protein H2200_005861 [Cladophialophora chaetospira]|uniref:Uncharacterized protein n=1 Tax=Cladophialophora chaetospira TaxID=386627 RepID=A0AA38X9U8_9EURO|nr:hypothetical protein H2200_005861 [Cladophialophora chaetospira]
MEAKPNVGAMDSSAQDKIVLTASSISPAQHRGEALSLLTVPAEVRVRIYKALSSELILIPGWRDLGPGPPQALIHQARHPPAELADLLANHPLMDIEMGSFAPARPRQPANLNLLLACRKIYEEAYPVLLRSATFSLTTIEDHIRITQPRFLPLLGRIHRLSVGSSLLAEWSSTLVRLILPSVSQFEIRDLKSLISHDHMLSVDSGLSQAEPPEQNDASVESALFQQLLLGIEEASILAAVFSHFTVAAAVYKSLVLHFEAGCHWGNIGPHDHPANHCVFAFGQRHPPAEHVGLTTLPRAHWAETCFIFREKFSLADETRNTFSPYGFEDELLAAT